ncbi:unnamed protein product [Somion occarium]|uniref:Peptidase C14 caspase domain-containing protein n=2 Tax=Somion occarium TaxID=3059160 RepID=A0ABP1DVL2_9APHY
MGRVFALLVGITQMKDGETWDSVEGAGKDLENMNNYLEQELHVPPKHICILRGSDATRDGIIDVFRSHLIDNESIRKGDAIIFYYSGHGDTTQAPEGWNIIADDQLIESLAPYDYGTPGADTKLLGGIPDRTIAALLEQVANKHGDNITVILDCCHSGHGTRGGSEKVPLYQVRGIDPTKAIRLHEDVDREIWSSVSASAAQKFWRGAFAKRRDKSHVLLAACGPREDAVGNAEGGIFTRSLIATLCRQDIRPRSYAEVMKHVTEALQNTHSWSKQRPQCEGVTRDRLIFQEVQIKQDMFEAKWQANVKNFRIEGPCGVLGVLPETQIELYSLNPQYEIERIVGTATVTEVESDHCLAKVAEDIDVEGRHITARILHHPYKLRFALTSDVVELSEAGQELFELLDGSFAQLPRTLERVSTDADPDLILKIYHDPITGAGLSLHRKDLHLRNLATPPPLLSMEELKTTNIIGILNRIAHFNFYLDQTNELHPYAGDVQMEFWLLGVGRGTPRPLKKEEIFKNDEATIVGSNDNGYAFVLRNTGKMPLYPHIIYFDTCTYEISVWWSSADATPPLKPRGKLQIGASAEHRLPFEFFVPAGQTIDTSMLKVFLMQSPMKLDFMKQGPQLGPDRVMHALRASTDRDKETIATPPVRGGWDSITYKITVRNGNGKE